jgi:hypothetical protein
MEDDETDGFLVSAEAEEVRDCGGSGVGPSSTICRTGEGHIRVSVDNISAAIDRSLISVALADADAADEESGCGCGSSRAEDIAPKKDCRLLRMNLLYKSFLVYHIKYIIRIRMNLKMKVKRSNALPSFDT